VSLELLANGGNTQKVLPPFCILLKEDNRSLFKI